MFQTPPTKSQLNNKPTTNTMSSSTKIPIPPKPSVSENLTISLDTPTEELTKIISDNDKDIKLLEEYNNTLKRMVQRHSKLHYNTTTALYQKLRKNDCVSAELNVYINRCQKKLNLMQGSDRKSRSIEKKHRTKPQLKLPDIPTHASIQPEEQIRRLNRSSFKQTN